MLLRTAFRDLLVVSITVIFRLAERERRIPTLKLARLSYLSLAATTKVESEKSSCSSGELEIDLTSSHLPMTPFLAVYSVYIHGKSDFEEDIS